VILRASCAKTAPLVPACCHPNLPKNSASAYKLSEPFTLIERRVRPESRHTNPPKVGRSRAVAPATSIPCRSNQLASGLYCWRLEIRMEVRRAMASLFKHRQLLGPKALCRGIGFAEHTQGALPALLRRLWHQPGASPQGERFHRGHADGDKRAISRASRLSSAQHPQRSARPVGTPIVVGSGSGRPNAHSKRCGDSVASFDRPQLRKGVDQAP